MSYVLINGEIELEIFEFSFGGYVNGRLDNFKIKIKLCTEGDLSSYDSMKGSVGKFIERKLIRGGTLSVMALFN